MADELKDQRVVTMMSPSELEAIDEWMFKNRLKSRGEAIRRLCHVGMRAEERDRELLQLLMKGLDREGELLKRLNPDGINKIAPMEIFEEGQAFLREVYALVGAGIMEGMVFRTAPSSREGIATSKEIADRLKALGSTKKQVDTFVNFSEMLKADRKKTAEEDEET